MCPRLLAPALNLSQCACRLLRSRPPRPRALRRSCHARHQGKPPWSPRPATGHPANAPIHTRYPTKRKLKQGHCCGYPTSRRLIIAGNTLNPIGTRMCTLCVHINRFPATVVVQTPADPAGTWREPGSTCQPPVCVHPHLRLQTRAAGRQKPRTGSRRPQANPT